MDISELETLIELQAELGQRIISSYENLKKVNTEKRTRGFLTAKRNEFQQYYNQLNEQHNKIFTSSTITHRKSMKYFTEKWIEHFNDTVHKAEARVEEWYDLVTAHQNTNNLEFNSTALPSRSDKLKMPRIHIEPFSGDYHKWITFKNLFIDLVYNKPEFTPVEKFHYLMSNVAGEAKAMISHFTITPENYESAWKSLLDRYDNKRILVFTEIKRLMNLQKINSASASTIKHMLDTIRQSTSALENLQIATSTWDPILVYMFIQKIDDETYRQWQISTKTPKDVPKLQDLLNVLENRFHTLENNWEPQRNTSTNTQWSNQKYNRNSYSDRPINQHQSTSNSYNSNNRNNNHRHSYSDQTSPRNTYSQNASSSHNNPFRQRQPPRVSEQKAPRTFFVHTRAKCPVCEEQHSIFQCQRFERMNLNEKHTFIDDKSLCKNCLGNHTPEQCKCSQTCQICHYRHHTLLHEHHNNQQGQSTSNSSSQGTSASNSTSPISTAKVISHLVANKKSSSQILLATALVYVTDRNGARHKLRCLLDQGSQVSFITKSAAQFLKLELSSVSARVSGIGAAEATSSKSLANLQIESKNNNFKLPITALVLKKITDSLPSSKVAFTTEWLHIQGLELADPDYHQPNKIDMLLGADVYCKIILQGVKKGIDGAPIAQQTQLGWILSGQIHSLENNENIDVSSSTNNNFNIKILSFHHKVDIDTQLKAFWEMEELPEKRTRTTEEEACEKIFIENYQRDSNGRFIVKLPFRENRQQLGESKYRALLRLKQLESKFSKNQEFFNNYRDVIEDYKQQQHIRPIADFPEKDCYYMPHHAVIKESSTTTKVRIVFDASAKTTSGESLNDQLLVGPNLQQDLASILLRWRTHKIVLSADITQMYRQIRVREEDTRYQRFLWYDHPQKVNQYELTTLTFGTASAAYLAVRSLQQLASSEKVNYPIASDIAMNDFYVDDLLTGADNRADAVDIYKQMSQLLLKGGFEIKKWISNDTEVLRNIPQESREIELPLSIYKEQAAKTLGMHFYPANDEFQFKVQPFNTNKEPTKRSLLADTSRLFDPLGLVAPVTIKSKIFLQNLWQQGYQWDQKLTGILKEDWLKFGVQLKTLENIKINRWLGNVNNNGEVQLHGFCDASEKAYAAVVYTRVQNSDGIVTTTIVTAKTRVAPLKVISLPRLELCGAALLAKLLTFVKTALLLDSVSSFAWTDSEIVLAWLSTQPAKLKTFVANRVVEIGKHTNNKQWRHISSKQNPADCASRGLFPADLKEHTLWWSGPDWLSNNEWQKETFNKYQTTIDVKEVHPKITSYHACSQFNIIDKFSSYTKIIRVVATMRRFIQNCRNKVNRQVGPLSTIDIKEATKLCCKLAQQEFTREVSDLQAGKSLNSKSSILGFTPFLDNDGILRVGGRLQHSNLPYEQRHPILIPANCHFATLIIRNAHIAASHGGVQVTTSLTRKTYWILKSRNTVKRVLHQCITCHRYKRSTQHQLMGQLPRARLGVNRPFTQVGIDYAGPMDVKMSKGRGARSYKGYISLFVCMSTKAIHLEIVSDLTSEAFLAAFARFVGRRGLPTDVFSDNGTNFVGADRIMQRIINKSIRADEVSNMAAKRGIKWHFIPARSPHFGGLWEAGVKQMKRQLIKTVHDTILTYEEWATVLIQIEASLNSRPLIALTDDPDDLAALSPGHFLIGNELLAPPIENIEQHKSNSLTKWRRLNQIHQQFWRRWSADYITSLQQKTKWKAVQKEIEVGDMALLKDEQLPPNKWRLCRIVHVHPGDDNHVRVVTIKTSTGETKRAITKIALLPQEE